MVLKRKLCGGDEGSDSTSQLRKRDFRRKYALHSLLATVNTTSPQELGSVLEPFIRTCVKEEIELALRKFFRPSLNDTVSYGSSRCMQLHFDNKLPAATFTGCKLESEDISPIRVVLRDVSGKTIASGPLASAKLTIVVLDGDLNPDECDDLTSEEFNKRTVREREGKRPLVTGTRSLTLVNGVGYVGEISFTDNSSWVRSGKFRLGVMLHSNANEIGVKEGISSAFKVLDQRGESYKKNHPPSLVDEVWRLEKIAKDGPCHKRLTSNGIFTVRDFLRLYHTDSSSLRSILGSKTSNRIWDMIIGHAKECCPDKDELYVYNADDGTRLLFNSVYEVFGVVFDGQDFQYLHALNQPQKRLIEHLKLNIYKNLNHLVPLGGEPFFTNQLQSSRSQASCFSAPSIMMQNVYYTENQDERDMQCPILTAPVHVHGFEDKNELQVSVAESCGQIGECSPTFNDNGFVADSSFSEDNGFVADSSFSEGQTPGFDWDVNDFLLGPYTCPHIVDENIEDWQGNNFITAQGNVMTSNYDIHLSRNGRTKVCWCKLRAVVKWQMIKSSGNKNRSSSRKVDFFHGSVNGALCI